MAKSAGNIAPLHEVLERYGRDAVVMYLISGHYRQPLAFSRGDARAGDGQRQSHSGGGAPALPRPIRDSALDELRDRFFDALANDFNTPEALAHLNEWLREATRSANEIKGDAHLREMLGVLGLEGLLTAPAEAPADVEALATQREQARAERDFAAADRLREEIAAAGLGGPRRGGRLRVAAAVILYGRNPVQGGAARASRAHGRCGVGLRRRGPRAVAGGGGGAHGHRRGARRGAAARRPPGGLRGGGRLPVRLRR